MPSSASPIFARTGAASATFFFFIPSGAFACASSDITSHPREAEQRGEQRQSP